MSSPVEPRRPGETLAAYLKRSRAEHLFAQYLETVQRPDVTAAPHGPPVFQPTAGPSIGPVTESEYQRRPAERAVREMETQRGRLQRAGPLARTALEAARVAGAPVEAAIQTVAPGTQTGYQRGVQLREEGFDPTTGTERAIGGLVGAAPAFAGGEVAAAPLAQAVARRLGAAGLNLPLREAAAGLVRTSATLGTGTAIVAGSEAKTAGVPTGEAIAEAVNAGIEAALPTSPMNAALLAAGAASGLAKGVQRQAGYTVRARAVGEAAAARRAGFGPIMPEEAIAQRTPGPLDVPAFERRAQDLGVEARRAPQGVPTEAPPGYEPPNPELAQAIQRRDYATVDRLTGRGPEGQAGVSGAQILAPLATTGAGAAVGAATDKEHPLQGAIIGGLAGLVGGAAGSAALGRVGNRGSVPAVAERPMLEVQGRRAGGLPQSLRQAPEVTTNIRPLHGPGFDLDPTGEARLRSAESEILTQYPGLTARISWQQTRDIAKQVGATGADQLNGRLSGARMVAIRNEVSANADLLDRLGRQISDPHLAVAEVDKIRGQMAQIDAQNTNMLGQLIRAKSQVARDLNSLKMAATRVRDPGYWWERATQFAGRDLSALEKANIARYLNDGQNPELIRYVSGLRQSTTAEKALTFWKAMLLTNPKTHIVNITSNTTMGALETAKDPVAALADRALGLFTGRRTKGGISSDLWSATRRGWSVGRESARQALRGLPVGDLGKGELVRRTTYDNAFLQATTDVIFNTLSAEDQVFYSVAMERSLAEQGRILGRRMGLRGDKLRAFATDAAQGKAPLSDPMVANAIDAMFEQAKADAATTTFRRETAIGEGLKGFRSRIEKFERRTGSPPIVSTAFQVVLPFTRTPSAVATSAIEYSPLGFSIGAVNAIRTALQGRGAPVALQRLAAEQLGRGVTGTGLMYLGYHLAKEGMMTGGAPSFGTSERNQWIQENRQANSLLVNGEWWNIGRISPVGNLLAAGANLYQRAQTMGDDVGAAAGNVVAGVLKTVADQPFVTGVSGALAALQEPEREAGRFVEGLAGSVVPAGVAAVARGTDIPRTAELPEGGPLAKIGGAVVSRIPVAREILPPKISPLGEAQATPPARLLDALFNPATASPSLRSDPVVAEMARVGYGIPQLRRPSGESPTTYAKRRVLFGRYTHGALQQVIQTQEYQQADDERKADLLQRAVADVRHQLRQQLGEAK